MNKLDGIIQNKGFTLLPNMNIQSSIKVFTEDECKQIALEFAKLHVKSALEAAHKITHKNGIPRIIDNEDSILNAYPDNLIK